VYCGKVKIDSRGDFNMEYDNYIQRLKVNSSNVVLEFKIGFFKLEMATLGK
jgi:hypothetical protein